MKEGQLKSTGSGEDKTTLPESNVKRVRWDGDVASPEPVEESADDDEEDTRSEKVFSFMRSNVYKFSRVTVLVMSCLVMSTVCTEKTKLYTRMLKDLQRPCGGCLL